MKKGQIETLKIRMVSTLFVGGALTVFQPFGFDLSQWQTCLHLLAFLFSGVLVCMLTDVILKYVFKMPHTNKRGIDYIIRRNLLFQFINTPLVSLVICLYRHLVLNNYIEGNQLSWLNYLETLVIIGFCSFAIGLYWRFKFRSKFLAAELEETRLLNEHLKKIQTPKALPEPLQEEDDSHTETAALPSAVSDETTLVLKGTTSESITLSISTLLYVEAVGNYVKVYRFLDGTVHTDMLRATSKQIEDDLRAYPMIVRCHRAFLVNLTQVERINTQSGSMQLVIRHCHDMLPVSRSNMSRVKEAINGIS